MKERISEYMKVVGLGAKEPEEGAQYATFNRRMWAATIDSLIVMILIAPPVDYLFLHFMGAVPLDTMKLLQDMAAAGDDSAAHALLWDALLSSGALGRFLVNTGVQFVILGIATAFCWRTWSATPGKMLCGIRIVDAESGEPMTDRQIAVRFLGYVVSSIPIFLGFFWISFNKRRQAWHDMMAGTVVVRD